MKKFILISLIGIFIPALLFGQAKVGTAGAQFLEIGVGARAEGMAQSFLATADDATSLYYNPGATALLTQREIVFTHIEYPADINLEYIGFVYPNLLGGNFGVQCVALTALDMIETTPYHTAGTGRTFSASDFSGALTYSRRLTELFSVGVSVKYIGEFFAEKEAHGWGVDIGTLFRTGFKTIRIGMKMSNFGPDMGFYKDINPYPLPMTFHFGLAGDPIDKGLHKLTVNFEGSHPPDNQEKFQVGMEYCFASRYSLRAGKFICPTHEMDLKDEDAGETESGVEYTDNSRNFALGAGAKLPLAGVTLKLDYSYTIHRNFNIHRITGGLQF